MSIFPTKILLATDGSKEATLAADTATDIAGKTGSELHVVYVEEYSLSLVSAYGSFAYTDAETIQSLAEQAQREARKLLDEQVDNLGAAGGTVNKSYLKLGRPDREIVGLAEEISAGLIVVGSRGLGGIRRALMGRVSSSVVNHAHCPVLVVRGEKGGEQGFSAKRILLATDGSEEAALAAQTVVDLADKTNSAIHVVYVTMPLYEPSYYEGVYIADEIAEEQKEIERSAQELLNEQVEKLKAAGGRVAQAHLRTGMPDRKIVNLAEEIGVGLIVMGSRGLSKITRLLMGSVSEAVVRHAHCPVLVVRQEEPVKPVEEAGPEEVGLV